MKPKDKKVLDEIISNIPNASNNKIGLLQKVQERFEYLRDEHLRYLAKSIGTSYTDLYGIATFYSFFNLYPAGRHTIFICEGTSCHVKGGQRLRKKLKDILGIDIKETTPDKRFSLKSIRCLGCCGISPVIMIDKETFGRVKPTALEDILSKFK